MLAPTFIHSPAEFQSAVTLKSTALSGTPESLVLEFKGQIDGWNGRKIAIEERRKEVCRDIAQFANTFGGCLLVGVEEEVDPNRGIKVATSIRSVNEPEKLLEQIEQAIANYLQPATFSHSIVPITVGSYTILAINVPPSRYLVSLWDNQARTVQYVRRTSYGKEYMNPDEVERHLMDGSRAAKLALIAAMEKATSDRVVIASGLWNWNPHGPYGRIFLEMKFAQLSDYWFELNGHASGDNNQFSVTIPYGVVSQAWVDASGTVILLLSVRIVRRDKELTIEPYT